MILVTRTRLTSTCSVMSVLFALVGLMSCAGRTDSEAEVEFQALFGSTLSNKLLIEPERQTYHRDDVIVFWVKNRTGQVIWFPNQSFGVKAYAYDTRARRWDEVDLGFVESNASPMAVPPGMAEFPGILPVEYIDAPTAGKTRLVITGRTDLESPDRGETHTAYRDIDIVP